MPRRVDDGIAVGRDGHPDGRLFSPKAALYFIRYELKRSIGESTMRLWRAKGKGPRFHRDAENQLWYHERDLRTFYQKRPVVQDGRSTSPYATKRVVMEELRPGARQRLLRPDEHGHRMHHGQTAA